MNKGRVFIVSGPSGSGKDTVLKLLFERMPDIQFSISSITRNMREGEVEGEKYNFVTREKFEQMLKDDELLEHNVYLGNYYGTPKTPVINCVEKGKDVIIEVDVNGAAQIRTKLPETLSVFILPPSLEILKKRLYGRGTDSADVVEERLKEALGEISRAVEYDYIVVNDDLKTAVDELVTIISADSNKTARNLELINEILK